MKDNYFGRRKIYTATDEINAENVIQEVTRALLLHYLNSSEEKDLYWYRRGQQPILNRKKQRNEFVCNKIVVNFADQVVTFKNGYFLTKPVVYTSISGENTEKVKKLNAYLRSAGKASADNKVVDNFHTKGLGVIYVEVEDTPNGLVKTYSVDPEENFVVYSTDPAETEKFGVHIAIQNNNEVKFDVYTKEYIFRLLGGTANPNSGRSNFAYPQVITRVEVNESGEIPLIEYYATENRMAAFECAYPLINAYNQMQSDVADGVEQFIQSLLVILGADLDSDVDANYIKQHGIMCLPFVDGHLPEVKLLAEQLDQTQTQVSLDNLETQILKKCGMPTSLSAGGQSFENVGAAYMDRGYALADTFRLNEEDCYRDCNARFMKVFLAMLKKLVDFEIDTNDIEIQFSKPELDNMLIRTQAAMNLKALGLSPELVLAKTGISSDPISDVEASKDYIYTAFATETESANVQNE